MKRYVYDIEVYPNYMCVGFMSDCGNRIKQFESFDKSLKPIVIKRIKRLINRVELVGFNSKGFDDPILTIMLNGADTYEVYENVKKVIDNNFNSWEVYDKLNITKKYNSIDLIEVAAGQASLKLYGARLNCKKLQDLPYEPNTYLTKYEASEVAKYNINDLNVTLALYNKLKSQLSLREDISNKYDIDVMSKSDAQIAEAIFRHELTERGVKVQRSKSKDTYVRYKAPDCVVYRRKDLNNIVDKLEDTTIELSDVGQPLLPKWIKDTTINIGDTVYNIGLGGLHSQEKQLVVRPKEGEVLGNIDVASYYPSLILDLGLFPEQLTNQFLKVYQNIYNTRLDAKSKKDDSKYTKAEQQQFKTIDAVLKITLNGSYGKFGSKYSFLYSPHLLLTVTFTGQLYLLMLIEELEYQGFKVVSSNTDGVEILYKKDKKEQLEKIVSNWEKTTNMKMEYGEYLALFARDVNNYVAVYSNGKAKAKGAYADPNDAVPILSKNIEYPIVFEAIRNYLSKNIPMEETIYNCNDIARFTISRNVKGGAVFYDGELTNTDEYNNHIDKFGYLKVKAIGARNDKFQKEQVLKSDKAKYLGKVVRWYYSVDGKTIFYKTGNKVPKSDNSKPMMDLTDDIPKDLDYDKYLQLCEEHLKDLGI